MAGLLAVVYLQSGVVLFSICLALHVPDVYLYCPVTSAVFLGMKYLIILLTHIVEAGNSLQRDKLVKFYFSPKSCRWCITFTAWFTSHNFAGRDGRAKSMEEENPVAVTELAEVSHGRRPVARMLSQAIQGGRLAPQARLPFFWKAALPAALL